ncbi:transcriptional regulator [Mesorhizobium huakuii]|uniref:helix-turn-helix domain-containing protein n=1 Tax=Mesorhizobium TaxID=68287 RepID=UPI000499ED0B|nr:MULTISPECIES: helix-turn-helix transcriptional regulator [Mesorhizobium]AID28405.1 helix-turn-helix domain-containing protein [Mesorhizobium huakuii 7653R]MCH4559006.1 helix-turn-helix domain-containing protein [Mesorhizobium jarvisii]GLQ80659.1 transcriptional regulator [Mesorhizobium huakuii]
MKASNAEVHVGNPNIFAELGLPDAENHFLKAQIVAEVYRLVREQKLTQAKAGEAMGVSQPEVSRLFKGHFREYSVERLMNFLAALGQEVEIVSRPLPQDSGPGHITFRHATA